MPQVAFGLPNVISNVEDMNNVKATDVQQISSVDPRENQHDESMMDEQEPFIDITPQLKRSTRNKSKSRY